MALEGWSRYADFPNSCVPPQQHSSIFRSCRLWCLVMIVQPTATKARINLGSWKDYMLEELKDELDLIACTSLACLLMVSWCSCFIAVICIVTLRALMW